VRERREGSRFDVRQFYRQFYRQAAGGSREQPSIRRYPGRSRFIPTAPTLPTLWARHIRWVIPGSRLLPTCRSAALQSGSPAGALFFVTFPRVPGVSGVGRSAIFFYLIYTFRARVGLNTSPPRRLLVQLYPGLVVIGLRIYLDGGADVCF
jgi:hypothetical protein